MPVHPCPYCNGKGWTSTPADVQKAVHRLRAGTNEHRLLRALADRFDQWVETPTLMSRVYGCHDGTPTGNVISVMAVNLRRKLKPYGLKVEGYCHSSPGCFRLTLIEPH